MPVSGVEQLEAVRKAAELEAKYRGQITSFSLLDWLPQGLGPRFGPWY